jgi:hypothetical protein
LHGIQDEALDEGFPPNAVDAAELEAVAAFVECMAMLAYMEEREESARLTFCHIKKRWEVRRSEGLKGRPRPARHTVEEVKHLPKPALQTVAIVAANAHRHNKMKMRQQEFAGRRTEPRNAKHIAGAHKTMPIQQPRKNS